MKMYLGNGSAAPSILNLRARWRCVVSFMPRPLYPQGKNPWYPLDRRLGAISILEVCKRGDIFDDKESKSAIMKFPQIVWFSYQVSQKSSN
jgi:hypothetical protein